LPARRWMGRIVERITSDHAGRLLLDHPRRHDYPVRDDRDVEEQAGEEGETAARLIAQLLDFERLRLQRGSDRAIIEALRAQHIRPGDIA